MEIRTLLSPDRLRKTGVFAVVLLAHVGLFAVMARTAATPPMALPQVFEVELFRPAPPPPPPPPSEPMPPEVPAPREQAPEPEIVVGVAPTSSSTPGMGQGGQGSGAGTGVGAGDGPGRGVRTGPRNLRRPAMNELRPYHPRQALSAGVSGVVTLRCRISPDTRLEQCAVLSATPDGYGFGDAGLRAARDLYRFRPATLDGAYDDSVSVTVTLEFGRS